MNLIILNIYRVLVWNYLSSSSIFIHTVREIENLNQSLFSLIFLELLVLLQNYLALAVLAHHHHPAFAELAGHFLLELGAVDVWLDAGGCCLEHVEVLLLGKYLLVYSHQHFFYLFSVNVTIQQDVLITFIYVLLIIGIMEAWPFEDLLLLLPVIVGNLISFHLPKLLVSLALLQCS